VGEKENTATGSRSGETGSSIPGKTVEERGNGVGWGLEFLTYTEQIKQRVREGWIVPERRPGLTTVIRFGVEANGEIFAVELMKSSGDTAFDQSALRAVKRANPLPSPPPGYQQEFATEKVEVTFSGDARVE
jgi:colicin import membrane protein